MNPESDKRPSTLDVRLPALYGLVLAGGRSLRMGEEKASIRYHGRMQSDHCMQLLRKFCEKSFVSIRAEQKGDSAFDHLPQIQDCHEVECPLNGILSAMIAHPDEAWLVLGCDLPFVDERTISLLVEKRDPSCQATAFRRNDDGLPEPMCAIYEPSIRPLFEKGMAEERRSPRHTLVEARVCLLPQPDSDVLINVNRPEHREQVEWLLKEEQ